MINTIEFFYYYFYYNISLLIGSKANYAGDGPKRIENSFYGNGFKICCMESRYYISEVDENILAWNYPCNDIQIGDEVIKLNDTPCENLQNVQKYIKNNEIQCLNLRSIRTNQYYTERMARTNEHYDETTAAAINEHLSKPRAATAKRKRSFYKG